MSRALAATEERRARRAAAYAASARLAQQLGIPADALVSTTSSSSLSFSSEDDDEGEGEGEGERQGVVGVRNGGFDRINGAGRAGGVHRPGARSGDGGGDGGDDDGGIDDVWGWAMAPSSELDADGQLGGRGPATGRRVVGGRRTRRTRARARNEDAGDGVLTILSAQLPIKAMGRVHGISSMKATGPAFGSNGVLQQLPRAGAKSAPLDAADAAIKVRLGLDGTQSHSSSHPARRTASQSTDGHTDALPTADDAEVSLAVEAPFSSSSSSSSSWRRSSGPSHDAGEAARDSDFVFPEAQGAARRGLRAIGCPPSRRPCLVLRPGKPDSMGAMAGVMAVSG